MSSYDFVCPKCGHKEHVPGICPHCKIGLVRKCAGCRSAPEQCVCN